MFVNDVDLSVETGELVLKVESGVETSCFSSFKLCFCFKFDA